MNTNTIRVYIIGAIGLLGALFIGNWLPEANPSEAVFYSSILLLIFYTLQLSILTLIFALIVVIFDFRIAPGFYMAPGEICGGLFLILFIISFWKKNWIPVAKEKSFSSVYIGLCIIVTTFIIIHAFYNYNNTYLNYVFSISNAGKTYFNMLFPFLLLAWFVRKAPNLSVGLNPIILTNRILFFGLLLNIIIRIIGIFILGTYDNDSSNALESTSRTVINIPIINMTENVFALRMLSPFSSIYSSLLITSNKSESLGTKKFIPWMILGLSILGASISMGRVTVLFTIFLSLGIFIWRKRINVILISITLFVFVYISLMFVIASSPNKVPMSILRSVAFIPGLATNEALDSVSSSSDWRHRLYLMALEQWQSDNRVFWFGRSTSACTASDMAEYSNPALKEFVVIDLALKRGATHNLITDLLVNVGLVGFILYISLWISAIIMQLRFISFTKNTPAKIFFLTSLIFSIFFLSYALFGGGWYPLISTIFSGIGCLIIKYNYNARRS